MEAETICRLLSTEAITCDHRQTDMGCGRMGSNRQRRAARGPRRASDLERARELREATLAPAILHSEGSTVAKAIVGLYAVVLSLRSNTRSASLVLGRLGVPLGEHVRQFAQGESDREDALGCDVVLAVAHLSAFVGSERVQLVLTRPLSKNLGHGQRDASGLLRAVSSSSFRRSGAGIADSGNAGSNPAGGIEHRAAMRDRRS
jgi:hypothetical protein